MDTWKCWACDFVFESEDWPRVCPDCEFYSCGDDQCCGAGFYIVDDKATKE
jgi:hypothetical protein